MINDRHKGCVNLPNIFNRRSTTNLGAVDSPANARKSTTLKLTTSDGNLNYSFGDRIKNPNAIDKNNHIYQTNSIPTKKFSRLGINNTKYNILNKKE